MTKTFPYKRFMIKEGLKPESDKFQYFFSVSEGGEKKAHYCIWVDDEVLAKTKEFQKGCRGVLEEEFINTHKSEWIKWVEEKLDRRDFRNMVLKIEKGDTKEIDMSELKEKLEFE